MVQQQQATATGCLTRTLPGRGGLKYTTAPEPTPQDLQDVNCKKVPETIAPVATPKRGFNVAFASRPLTRQGSHVGIAAAQLHVDPLAVPSAMLLPRTDIVMGMARQRRMVQQHQQILQDAFLNRMHAEERVSCEDRKVMAMLLIGEAYKYQRTATKIATHMFDPSNFPALRAGIPHLMLYHDEDYVRAMLQDLDEAEPGMETEDAMVMALQTLRNHVLFFPQVPILP